MNKFFTMLSVLVLSVAAMAGTPFSNTQYSAEFNGAVSHSVDTNPTNTTYDTYSFDGIISEEVSYRVVDHDIAATTQSSDFYLNDNIQASNGTLIKSSQDVYQGLPFTYGYFTYTDKSGVLTVQRERFIIKNSREVFFISMVYPASLDATDGGAATHDLWQAFENTLVIK